eukprot:TRINITY_DN12211_c0_g1_i2.p1 TRINITY_DN12211_c0_g1~~TRINITY_DN12211_c0_g1_i2.p1  ORF type:complete len:304 (+),score=80.92 TRINITY_DN12211_c0_g1_i2:187-1098(+)
MVNAVGIYEYWNSSWWTSMLWIAVGLSIVGIVLGIVLPESPRWLVSQNRMEDARKSLVSLRSSSSGLDDELSSMQNPRDVGNSVSEWQNLKSWTVWGRILVGSLIQMFKQFSGITAVFFYLGDLFDSDSTSDLDALIATALAYLFMFFVLLVGSQYFEIISRKSLLLASFGGLAFWSILVGLFGSEIDALSYGVWIKAVLFAGYLGSFALGCGPISWIVCAEIFPNNVRNFATSFAIVVHWLCAFIVAITFDSIVNAFGSNEVFYLYGGICVIAMIFVRLAVPETAGKSLEQIERELHAGGRN